MYKLLFTSTNKLFFLTTMRRQILRLRDPPIIKTHISITFHTVHKITTTNQRTVKIISLKYKYLNNFDILFPTKKVTKNTAARI